MKWFFYALASSFFWGINYALMTPLLAKIKPGTLIVYNNLCILCLVAPIVYWSGGNLSPTPLISNQKTFWLFLLSVTCMAAGNVTILASIGCSKNAAISSLIEIAYPMWVLVFTASWLGPVNFGPRDFAAFALIATGSGLLVTRPPS